MRQRRFKNLKAPSIPRSSHSNSVSGGAANRINNLNVSAPYLLMMESGSTIFPRDLDITSASFKTMPCVSRLLNGSSNSIIPRSLKNLVKKREYNKCRIACSIPPIYWSTGIQYLASRVSKGLFLKSGEQNLKKYQEESKKVAIVSVSRRAFPLHLG